MSTLGDLLNITRPLILFDVETTSAEPSTARIVQLGMRIHSPGAEQVKEWAGLVNPGEPIPESSTRIHGITDAMVAESPRFKDMAANLLHGFTGADLGGYNVRFDLRVLAKEFERVSMAFDYSVAAVVDPLRLWQHLEPRDLSAAVRYWAGYQLDGAHDAMVDIRGTEDALLAQLGYMADGQTVLPRSMEGLGTICYPPDPNQIDADGKFKFVDGVPCFNFGKHKGKPMSSDRGYLAWMAGTSSGFSTEVRRIASDASKGVLPTRNLLS